MEKHMHCIDMRLEERLLSMQQCFLSKLDIIPDKLDAVVEAMYGPLLHEQPAFTIEFIDCERSCLNCVAIVVRPH